MAKRKGGRGVKGPAADGGSGWWLLGGLAVVGGIVAAIIWSQSKPAAKPAPTVRRNGGLPMPPTPKAFDLAASAAAGGWEWLSLDQAIQRVRDALAAGEITPAQATDDIRALQDAARRGTSTTQFSWRAPGVWSTRTGDILP